MKFHQILMLLLLVSGISVSTWAQKTASPQTEQLAVQDVTLKDVEAKDAIKNIGRNLKINVVFDESVRVQGKLDLELQNVTLESVLKIIMIQHKLRASWIEDNTIMVYADNAQLRQRFQEFKTWEPKSGPAR
jgi:hypothetical protein